MLEAMVVTPSPRACGDGRGVRPEVLGQRRASEVLSPHDLVEIKLVKDAGEVRDGVGSRMSGVSGMEVASSSRNRRNSRRRRCGFGEQIREPGGIWQRAFGGKRWRRSRPTNSNKRRSNWWSKSPELMRVTPAVFGRGLRPEIEDADVTLTSSIFFFFSDFSFNSYLLV